MPASRTVAQLLKDHVSLEVESIDRLYLNGYVPSLQTGGGLNYFLSQHRGNPIASPALLGDMTARWIKSVKEFADTQQIPLIRFEKGERKDDRAARLRQKHPVADGVVFIATAQEKDTSFKATRKTGPTGGVRFDFNRASTFVNHYYFYLNDQQWGPAFIKFSSYFPFAMKICLNGHEWAKRQLEQRGIGYESLDNGFFSCEDPEALNEICGSLTAADVESFLQRWRARIPWPFTQQDTATGYAHKLSIWQMEVALTQVFKRPLAGRQFFEEVIRDNLDLGRPERVALVVDRRIQRNTPGKFATRVITRDTHPSIHINYKRTGIKQYFKEGRALRTETTFGNTLDFKVGKSIKNLSHLMKLGKNMNRRLLAVERAGSGCVMSPECLQRLIEPSLDHEGNKAPGLKFGQPRVMALLMALCLFLHVPEGFNNRRLREQVARLLGLSLEDYSASKMGYDLKRMRLNGLIHKPKGSNQYGLTPYGMRMAVFLTKVYNRILRPGEAAVAAMSDDEKPPTNIIRILNRLEKEVDQMAVFAIAA